VLQIWDVNWFLDEDMCPCDVHFTSWLSETKTAGRTIFHFGTGGHHHVGLKNFHDGAPNTILGITASPAEHDAYTKLAIEHASLSRDYLTYFGDIYLLNSKLLPRIDIVTLFHLCEFRGESQDAYDALTDVQVVDTLLSVMPVGGMVALFTKSFAFDKARAIAEGLVDTGRLARGSEFKSLVFYTKLDA
jgi:hypothetical protein